MPPIEAFISSPSINANLVTKSNKHETYKQYCFQIDLYGTENGGMIEITNGSKRSDLIHIKKGKTEENKLKVVTKGGITEDIQLRFVGK